MSITRSYNKHNNTYYVYDTQYVWSEEKQKKVPKRTCIGKWDPESNQVIPTGSEGRLRKKVVSVQEIPADLRNSNEENVPDISELFSKIALNLKNINQLLSELASDFESIGTYLNHSDDSSKKKTSVDNPGD